MDILNEMMSKNGVYLPYDIIEDKTGSPGSYDYLKERFVFRPYQIRKVTAEFNQKFNRSLTVFQMGQIVASHEIGHAADPFLPIRMGASHKHHLYAKTNFFHEDTHSRNEYKKYARLKMTCEHIAWEKAPSYLLSPIPQSDFLLFQDYCLDTYRKSFQHEYTSLLLVSYIMKAFETWSVFFPMGTTLNYRYDSVDDSFYDDEKQSFTICFNHLLSKKTPRFNCVSTYSFALYQFVYEYLSSLLLPKFQEKKENILQLSSAGETASLLRYFSSYEKELLKQEVDILNEMATQFSSPSFNSFYSSTLRRKEDELAELEETLLSSLFTSVF